MRKREREREREGGREVEQDKETKGGVRYYVPENYSSRGKRTRAIYV